MASVSDLVNEIHGMRALIDSRTKAHRNSSDTNVLEEKLAGAVVNKIRNLASLDTAGSTALFTAASEAKLSDKASNALSTAIDAKLVAAVSADVVMTAAGTQNCANPEQWASDELVKSLKDKKKSLSVKL